MKKIVKEIVIIGLLLAAGLLIARFTPFPSSLSSMLLFVALMTAGVIREDSFRAGVSELFLKHMAFFFIPPAVKIIESLYLLEGIWPRVLLMMLISNTLVMGVTGVVVQRLLKKEEEIDHA